jgi:hypothetical protein
LIIGKLKQLVKMNSKMFPSTAVDERDTVLKLLQLSTSNFDSRGGSSGND